MSGHQPQQQDHSDTRRPPAACTGSSSRAVPSVETHNVSEADYQQPTTPAVPSPSQPRFRVPQSPRSATGEAHAKAAKVAIPRLQRPVDASSEGSARSGGRHRVTHACEPCRHRKTKCSGERPICRHCQDFRIDCYYADGKRDRVKKQFGSMTEKVTDYEKLLRDLLPRVSEQDAKLIKSSLEKSSPSEIEEPLTADPTSALGWSADTTTETSAGQESEVSGGAGSTGALDRTEEDFTREGAKATGFMGKNSEITWLQRLRQENRFGDPPSPNANENTRRLHNISSTSLHGTGKSGNDAVPLSEAAEGFNIHDSSYHLDDLTLGAPDTVDAFEMPPQETAKVLFDTYMQRVHPTFPLVGKVNLSAQFQRFVSNPVQRPPVKWLAIVNMMFAISAKYSHLIQAEWRGDERDHMVYFSRARLLTLNQNTFFEHPDLQMIQVLGLMSFYLMCTSQMNRAWVLTGTAVRMAVALGLNMRNDSANLKDSLKEIRYRLWWSLYILEHRLCSVTGRAVCILDDHFTTPLPAPIEEEKFETEEGRRFLNKESQRGERAPSSKSGSHSQSHSHSPSAPESTTSHDRSRSSVKSEQSRSPSTLQVTAMDLDWARDAQMSSSLYFLHLVQLTHITQTVFHQLYNPISINKTWSFVQGRIRRLNDQLDAWYRRLPPMLDFRRKQRDRDFYDYRLNLGFFYFGTKQMVNRPCLCRLDRKIPNQSDKSHEFNHSSATACVEAAQEMLQLIPDEPNGVGLLRVGPWWCILPYIVQSAAVLMLEISFRVHHMPEAADSILESSKKAIRWLHALGEEDLSAKRAWRLCNAMLHEAAVKIGRDVSDIPDKPPGRMSMSSSDGTASLSTASHPTVPDMSHSFQANQMNTSYYGNMDSIPAYAAFANYDQMMHYDQYFPLPDGVNVSFPSLSDPQYAVADASQAEMEFMTSAYHDHGGERPSGNDPRDSGGSEGGAGFMH